MTAAAAKRSRRSGPASGRTAAASALGFRRAASPEAGGGWRANITWRQEVGGSSIEASKIAGHSTVRQTEEYTKIQLAWQEELTRRIQVASVGEKQPAVVQ